MDELDELVRKGTLLYAHTKNYFSFRNLGKVWRGPSKSEATQPFLLPAKYMVSLSLNGLNGCNVLAL